jgi:molybdenum cofactor guanylyltransferase
VNTPISSSDITLGLLAGGKASRLGGIDKAWLERDGVPQVLRWRRRFSDEVSALLVSANRDPDRYAAHDLIAVPDRTPDAGPLGGLEALAGACTTQWLFTLPVDLVGTNDCLLRTLANLRGGDGAFAVDDDGVQPLVALWRCDALRVACAEALVAGDCAIHALQSRLHMARVVFSGFRFGNLNTPDDLHSAGVATDPPSI